MMKCGHIAALLAALCLLVLLSGATATERYEGRYICKQIRICDNSPSYNWTSAAAARALEPVKSLLVVKEDSYKVEQLKECIADGCCCKYPITISLLVRYKDQMQLDFINNWVLSIKNGTGTLFPAAICIIDSSNEYSQTNDKCIQPDMTGNWPVLCREIRACSTAKTELVAIGAVNAKMKPWFAKFDYNDQDIANYFFPTTTPNNDVLANCTCTFVVSIVLQLPINPKRENEISITLDEYIKNEVVTLSAFDDTCETKNTTLVYRTVHKDKCDLPKLMLAPPPPDGSIPTAPWCKQYLVCSNEPDWDWPKNEIQAGIKRIYDKAGIDLQDQVVVKQLNGNTISYGGKTCTCSMTGSVTITLPAVTYLQTWILYTGFLELMRADNPDLKSLDCVIDVYRQYIAETPVCQVPAPPNFYPPAGPPIMFSPPPPPPDLTRPQPPSPPPGAPAVSYSPPPPAPKVVGPAPPPPGIFPFNCVLKVTICDKSIDWPWTDTKLRLNAESCIGTLGASGVTFETGELHLFPGCRCSFPGYLQLTFPGGQFNDVRMNEVIECIVLNLRQKYEDTVCVEGEPAATCYAWLPEPKTSVVNGK